MLDDRYRRHPEFIPRVIDEELILIPLKNQAGALDSVFTLNETGRMIWDQLDGQRTLGAVLANLEAAFDAPPDGLRRDLESFIRRLLEARAIEAVTR